MVPEERIELSTYPLPRGCATTTLLRHPMAKSRESGSRTAAITYEGGERKVSEPSKNAKDVRTRKLEAALKENLRRRKAQARARNLQAGVHSDEGASKEALLRPTETKEPS
jgi:hypothetical protein